MRFDQRVLASGVVMVLVAAMSLIAPVTANASKLMTLAAVGVPASQTGLDVYLNAGVAVAPHDVWLVGTTFPDYTKTAARHWDGSTWSSMPTQDPGSEFNTLQDIDASSSTDVWAVGGYASSGSDLASLVEHWDGTSWTVVPVPDQSGPNQLLSVSVISSHDVWAAGWTYSPLQGFLLHWNGRKWSTEGVRGGQYFGLSAASDHDVWTTIDGHPSKWDGSRWSDKYLDVQVSSVADIGPDDVWFGGGVGWRHSSRDGFGHFDGTTWTSSYPDAPGHANRITSLSAVSSNDVWASGQGTRNKSQIGQVLHWDGTTWTAVLHRTHFGGNVWGVIGVGPNDAWAFGAPHGFESPIDVMHWNGSHWKYYAVP